jgi:methylmalonyl-CoA mutase cobalamin-binding domain/chain
MGNLTPLLVDLQEGPFLAQVKERLATGDDPTQLINECRDGMEQIGKLFETQEYFISDLMMAANMFSTAMEDIKPHLKGANIGAGEKIVVGTVQGDIHDIGKNILIAVLSCNGFEVIDLGVDVPPERFVRAIQESGAKLVGLSALLTTSFLSLKHTVEVLDAAGLRPKVKIMVGGGPVNEQVRIFAGADGTARDAIGAVTLAKQFAREVA